MNNITTTTIRDCVIESENSYIEEFDVNFTQSSETVKYENYSVRDVEKYPSIIKFIENTLSNFELHNKDEIINFIVKHVGLIELIEKVTLIISDYFPNNSFALEFDKDPEIPNFNKIVMYVKGEDETFDNDWEEVKKVNKEIRTLTLYDDSVKNLLFVDLW